MAGATGRLIATAALMAVVPAAPARPTGADLLRTIDLAAVKAYPTQRAACLAKVRQVEASLR